MWSRLIVCGAGLCLLASVALAKQGIVRTKEDQVYEGDIAEQEQDVVVTIRGIKTKIDRNVIVSIEYPKSFEDRYKERLSKLEAKDVKGRLELARWAFENHEYQLSRDAAEKALAIDANNSEAMEMLALIQNQIRLERDHGPSGGRQATRPSPPVVATTGPVERRYLSASDINILKQKELQKGDNVAIRFDSNVLRRYAAATNQDLRKFNELKPVDQALEIFQGDVRFHDDVKITRDPAALAEYRRLQPVVLSACASSGCHGGSSGKGFILYNPATEPEAAYTNFFILQTYVQKVPGGGGENIFSAPTLRKMIDRSQPERSLLLQFALPPEVAEFAHPQVSNRRPPFVNKESLQYRQLLKWIQGTLKSTEVDYGIKYHVPGAATTTKPTTEPATQPVGPSAPPTRPATMRAAK